VDAMTIDDLKCCGNCMYRNAFEFLDENYVNENCKFFLKPSCELCGKWEFDGMKMDTRRYAYHL